LTRVAVDAMGGDRAPAEIVRGAVQAQSLGCELILVGRRDDVLRELRSAGAKESDRLRIVHAPDVVAMDDPATSARRKKDSSLVVAVELVKRGEADAVVSAGNSGAMMAAALFTLGRIAGIERPAIASVMPTKLLGEILILDVGANVDCSPENLVQFAFMGAEYAKTVQHIENPTVGLLSIGEEECKGNIQTRVTLPLLRQTSLNFIGNVEGRDIFSGKVHVIVCDGFVGNVALKTAEGTAEMVQAFMRAQFRRSAVARMIGLMAKPVLRGMRSAINYDRYGGAPLLGVNGVCIISHGRSNARAISNAIREADEAVQNNIVDGIRRAVEANAATAQ
jgi:glycerol-3-phosphate acyltransferase PlsX